MKRFVKQENAVSMKTKRSFLRECENLTGSWQEKMQEEREAKLKEAQKRKAEAEESYEKKKKK